MRGASLAVSVLLAALVIGVIWTRFLWGALLVETVVVREGRLQPGFRGEALLIRDESLYASPRSGVVSLEAQEGTLIIPGTAVARVDGSTGAPAETDALLDQLSLAVRQFRQDNEPTLSELAYQGQVRSDDLIRAVEYVKQGSEDGHGQIRSVAQRYWEWQVQWQALWDEYRSLEGERARLEGWIEELDQTLTAPGRGIISYRYDGLEDDFRLEGPYPDPSQVEEMMARGHAETAHGQSVRAGEVLFRLVDPSRVGFYLVAGDEDARWAQVGMKARLRLPSGDEVPAVLEYVSPSEGGRTGLLLVTDRFLDEFALSRCMEIEVRMAEISGVILPAQSVVVRGDQPGVWLWHLDRPQWQPVSIKAQVGDRVAVGGVRDASSVVVNPLSLLFLGVR